ncbi:thiamine phosphate synthase [Sulfurovum sp. zt1-1]|uniref:Thiamine phosphate synthase n=1 Tax=Sulfurovum zhangzhouensis TaxID=3019067 RepID=A0ABT7QVZ2_9BACT|nr:thiamine phosphate synthase [Sulfurovum zhangzhouensis]MDM5270952.1 thiamine phosphate synthase [Sulfurovum zhangzhouensis]
MLSYAITDPSTLSFDHLDTYLSHISGKADMVLYRDKQNFNYSDNAKIFIEAAKKYSFDKLLLHNEILLAKEIKADGVHLSSDRLEEIPFAKEKGLFVIISTHTLKEAQKAEMLGADMVTFSPVYDTPNKGKPVGLEKLREVSGTVNIPVIALGGILTTEQIKSCQKVGAYGFASIRYFK